MNILGINAFHGDAAACLLRDGTVVNAAEEERFRRIKHWAGFPEQAISWCLADQGLTLADLDAVAVNTDPNVARQHRLKFLLKTPSSWPLALSRLRQRKRRAAVPDLLRSMPGGDRMQAQVIGVEHHLTHLVSAYSFSEFDQAVVMSMDGFGDFASASWGTASNGLIEATERIRFPHSMGIFYETVTHYLGFKHYGDEYKVMGLASYGQSRYLDAMRKMVRSDSEGRFALNARYFRHQKLKDGFRIENGIPVADDYFTTAWDAELGPARQSGEELNQRHKDIAASAQALYEEILFALLNRLAEKTPYRQLALAGGCAMNSVANGKIAEQTPFEEFYIPPAAGDAGGSVGAAAWAYQQLTGARVTPMTHAYLGYQADASELAQSITKAKPGFDERNASVQQIQDDSELSNYVAEAIANGAVVGWFQGRMEWGPRALGARSILCDPRRADAKDLLNAKIKRRESFRPFAPAILREEVREWFTRDADVPFMMQVLPISEDKRKQIPAVTHVDGSGRLQTVTRDVAPRYYDLIAAFFAKTGVPILLNTSFNENEPIVCTPEQAIDCFLRTNMDMLVLEDYVVTRGESL